MNLRDLEYLVAVADERHFRKAAEQCNVSQPTLSGQLKKLEEYLGVKLLERTNRRVMLTLVGEEIVERAREVLTAARGLEEMARSYENPMCGKMNLGLIPTVAPYLLPHITGPIQAKFPQLELLWRESKTEVLVDELKKGRLDLILLALPVAEADGLREIHLYEERFLFAVHEGHPLAEKKEMTTKALKGQRVLLLEEGHCLRGQALEVCVMAGANEASDFRATSLETLRHLAAAGNGATLLPELATGSALPGIRMIPFQEPSPLRSIGMLYRKSSGNAMCYKALGELIREVMSQCQLAGPTRIGNAGKTDGR